MLSSALSQAMKAPSVGMKLEHTVSQRCGPCYMQLGSRSLPNARRLRNRHAIERASFIRGGFCALEGTAVEREEGRGAGRWSMLGGGLAAGVAVCMSAVITPDNTALETNHGGSALVALPYKQEGYNYWDWRGFKIHYVEEKQNVDDSLPPILLIHGFGASAFHWRYNIPDLAAKGHQVYAMCLLGFGWSQKTIAVEYSQQLWTEQITDFIREVVGRPVIIAGNSLGGYAALATSVSSPELVKGLVVLNGAGEFGANRRKKEVEVESEDWVENRIKAPLMKLVERVAIYFTFLQAKQPARIEAVLRQVYKDQSMVDDYLVQSIVKPSLDPGAAQVYYKVVTQTMLHPSNVPLDQLYAKLDKPLLLLWGVFDPWMNPRKAEMIKQRYPSATFVPLQAGHCPHDEVPEQVNKALVEWIAQLPA